MWVCNNCGHTNGDNANHCKYCNAQKHVERKKHVSIIIPIIMNVALILIVFSFWVHEYRDNKSTIRCQRLWSINWISFWYLNPQGPP